MISLNDSVEQYSRVLPVANISVSCPAFLTTKSSLTRAARTFSGLKVNAAQQVLEARVGAQWIEGWLHVNATYRTLLVTFF